MKDFLQKNARTVTTILVAFLTLLFPGTDFSMGDGFFELVFGNLAIPVGTGLMLLLNWIGDRNLWVFTKSPAFLTAIAVAVTLLSSLLGAGAGVYVDFLTALQATGQLSLGLVFGLLTSLFGDKNIPFELDVKSV